MATIDLTNENFEKTVNDNPMVVVDFWAPWCGPCRGFAPVYEQASDSHPDVVFAKVNTDEQQELAGTFGIRSIPTLMVFREKVILFQQAGALPILCFLAAAVLFYTALFLWRRRHLFLPYAPRALLWRVAVGIVLAVVTMKVAWVGPLLRLAAYGELR